MTFRRPSFLVPLLIAVSLYGSSLAAENSITVHFEESYRGEHPAEFAQVLEQVKAIVPGAIAYISEQWNLPNTLHYPLAVIITDSPPNFPAGASAAYVRTVIANGTLRQTLIVDLSHYARFPDEKLDDLLYHEMAHAVLQDAMMEPGSASVGAPQWFNEGLAQSVTPEGHNRAVEDFKRFGHSDARALLCDLNGRVDTFYHGEYNFGCYTTFYLAVQRFIQLGGKDAIVNTIASLRGGIPLPNIIPQITKLDWPAFQREVERYTRDVIAQNSPIP